MKKILLAILILFSLSASAQNVRSNAWFDFTMYAGVNDSSTDNTAALRTLLSWAPAGSWIYFPPGKGFLFTDSVKIGSHTLVGAGMAFMKVFSASYTTLKNTSLLVFTSATKNFLILDSSGTNNYNVSEVQKISIINNQTTPSAGAGFVVYHNQNNWSLDRVLFSNFYIDVNIVASYYWKMHDCRINAPHKYGIQLGNNIDSDLGDWSIESTIFTSGTFTPAPTAAFYWKAGGGGKMVNCKFNSATITNSTTELTNFNYDFLADFSDGPTSDFLCSNTSLENYQVSAFKVTNLSGSLFSHFQLNNIQCSPVDFNGTARSAIDINGINLVTIDNFVGRNYAGAVPFSFITLTGVNGAHIGGTADIVDFTSYYTDGGGNSNIFLDYFIGNKVQVLGSTTDNSILTGSIGLQGYAVNNTFLNENCKYNGGWVFLNNGYAENWFMGAGEIAAQITAASGTAGGAITFKIPFRASATLVALGGDIQSAVYAGRATVIIGPGVDVLSTGLPSGASSDSVVVAHSNANGITTLKKIQQNYGQTTLVAGTKAITITGLTTSSIALPGLAASGGTGGIRYKMVCTTNTLTITAVDASGATVTTDTSTINYFVIN